MDKHFTAAYRFLASLALTVLCLCSLQAAAQDEPIVTQPSAVDQQYLQHQRDTINDITSTSFGERFNGSKQHDIALLQRLLDEHVVANDDSRKLQAMGVILGDLLADELGMHWVIYKDKLGRSHALQYRDSDNYLFPITMISRRREADNLKPVADIYAKAESAIRAVIPAPYQ